MRVRNFIRTAGLVLLVTLAGVVGVQAPAAASFTSSTQTFELIYGDVNGQQVATADLNFDWPLGDCTQLFGSRVELNLATGAVTWNGAGHTSHTNNGDVWHSTFTFQGNSVSRRTDQLDSPTMFVGRGYVWTRSTAVSVPAGFHPASVVWQSAC